MKHSSLMMVAVRVSVLAARAAADALQAQPQNPRLQDSLARAAEYMARGIVDLHADEGKPLDDSTSRHIQCILSRAEQLRAAGSAPAQGDAASLQAAGGLVRSVVDNIVALSQVDGGRFGLTKADSATIIGLAVETEASHA